MQYRNDESTIASFPTTTRYGNDSVDVIVCANAAAAQVPEASLVSGRRLYDRQVEALKCWSLKTDSIMKKYAAGDIQGPTMSATVSTWIGNAGLLVSSSKKWRDAPRRRG